MVKDMYLEKCNFQKFSELQKLSDLDFTLHLVKVTSACIIHIVLPTYPTMWL